MKRKKLSSLGKIELEINKYNKENGTRYNYGKYFADKNMCCLHKRDTLFKQSKSVWDKPIKVKVFE